MNSKFSRRAILQALGVSAAFLPLLQARKGVSANSTLPKRLVLMAWPNGVISDAFWPAGGFPMADPASFTISADEQSVLKPLIPHQKDILIVGGMTYPNQKQGGGHASMPFMFTGVDGAAINGTISDGVPLSAGGPSVDMFIANEFAKSSKTPIHSLQLQCIKQNGNDRFISFHGSALGGQPNAPEPETDPVRLFDRLFGGAALTSDRLARIRAARKSVFDYLGRDLEAFGKNMGTEDRQQIAQHLASVRQLEQELQAFTATCSAPTRPDASLDYVNSQYTPLIPTVHKLQADMVVTALACDLVRVASLLWSNSSNWGYSFFWLGDEFITGRDADNAGSGGPLRQHHEIAHHAYTDAAHTRRKNLVDQWFISQFAYILERMKQYQQPDGSTLLDQSAVLCANVFGEGASHRITDLPWVLAGSCGGHFKTGQFLRWVGGKADENVSNTGLLTALCQAMGMNVDRFGDPQYFVDLPALRA